MIFFKSNLHEVWDNSSPLVYSQQIGFAKLDSAIRTADNTIQTDPRTFFKNVESFLVYADGRTIFERYYGGTNKVLEVCVIV